MTSLISSMRVLGKPNLLPFQKGIIQSCNALKMLFDEVGRRYGFKYILAYSLNQDVLENFFGVIRSKGGLHDCPDRQEFKYRLRSYILGYNEGALSENGNTLPDDTLDLEGLNYPLTGTIFKTISKEICVSPLPEEIELEDMAYDGLENLAGYTCHKLSAEIPELRVNPSEDNSYTWVNHLSEGGLSKPTGEMMQQMTTLEIIFNEFNGPTINVSKNNLKLLLELSSNVPCDLKVKKLFFRSRMYFRIRNLKGKC